MSFGGHVMDMINRMKNNRAQRPSQRAKYKDKIWEGIYSGTSKTTVLPNFKVVSEEELTAVKKRINERAVADRKKEKLFQQVFSVLAVLAFMALLIWLA
jgi:hypothetical protein